MMPNMGIQILILIPSTWELRPMSVSNIPQSALLCRSRKRQYRNWLPKSWRVLPPKVLRPLVLLNTSSSIHPHHQDNHSFENCHCFCWKPGQLVTAFVSAFMAFAPIRQSGLTFAASSSWGQLVSVGKDRMIDILSFVNKKDKFFIKKKTAKKSGPW